MRLPVRRYTQEKVERAPPPPQDDEAAGRGGGGAKTDAAPAPAVATEGGKEEEEDELIGRSPTHVIPLQLGHVDAMKLMQPELRRLLFSEGVLFVEGKSDVRVVEALRAVNGTSAAAAGGGAWDIMDLGGCSEIQRGVAIASYVHGRTHTHVANCRPPTRRLSARRMPCAKVPHWRLVCWCSWNITRSSLIVIVRVLVRVGW